MLSPSGDWQAEKNYIQTNIWQQMVPVQIVLKEGGGHRGSPGTPGPIRELFQESAPATEKMTLHVSLWQG